MSCDGAELARRLEEALENLPDASDARMQDVAISLDQIQGDLRHDSKMHVVDWTTASKVAVEVCPLDAQRLFSHDKTYVLFGLSGQIGQSLCDWMVANGAGCVCLTSRNPKVDQKWLRSFKDKNVTVKVYSMYVWLSPAPASKLETSKLKLSINTGISPINPH